MMMRSRWLHFLFIVLPYSAAAQITINVDASNVTGSITPLWGDHYEMHLLTGAGGNPSVVGPHLQFINDPGFDAEMALLKPRFIRVSTARFDDPGSADHYSTDTTVLKNLWTEFYHGPNSMNGANNLGNYDFSYVDSLIDVVHAMGAEPFLDMASMPFTLASVDTPAYYPCIYWNPPCHLLGWDNGIRQAPPTDPLVYSRVFYQLVKHLYVTRNVKWFEVWNEPDQFPGLTPFWDGTAAQLHAMMAALADEIGDDPALSPHVKLGCCSFAMQSFLNLFPVQFLSIARDSSTRMDFISVHPYSTDAFGGYDSTKASIAQGWKNTFFPNSDLINAEWGVLNPAFGAAGWNSLDYGLDRIRGIIEMNDRGFVMAHAASMTDNDTTAATCCLGMFYSKPTFAPKPAAFAYMAMNRMLNATDRIACAINAPHLALGGRTTNGDTVYVVLPAPDPGPDTGTVELNISGLPWTEGHVDRYELTMTSYDNDEVLTLVGSGTISSGSYTGSVEYTSDQGDGRLMLWEFVRDNVDGLTERERAPIQVVPNPARNVLRLVADGSRTITDWRILTLQGSSTGLFGDSAERIDVGELAAGTYLIEASCADGNVMRAVWMKQ